MNRKSKSFSIIFLMALLLLSCLSFLQFKTVESQNHEPVTYRGANYIDTDLRNGTHSWQSAPQWVIDPETGEYFPYTFENKGTYYEVRTGLIGAEIHRGKVSFYDPDMNRKVVGRENWIAFERQGDAWIPVCASLLPYFQSSSYVEAENFIEVTGTWATSKGTLEIVYHFEEKLKHTVTWTPNHAGKYALVQFWNETYYSDVTLGNRTVIKRTQGDAIIGKTDSLIFLFGNESQPFGVFENQQSARDFLHKTLFAKGTINYQGIKITNGVAWIFYNATLSIVNQGQPIVIDPTTSSLSPPLDDSFVKESNPNGNYGNSATLELDEGATNRWCLFKWNLTSLGTDIYITSAETRLYMSDVTSIVDPAYQRRITSNWAEGTVTWNNKPSSTATGQVYFKTEAGDGVGDTKVVDATAIVTSWIEDGTTNYGLYQLTNAAGSGDLHYHSKEAANDPVLYIVYSTAPRIDSATITNMDDTDNMYAMKQYYTFQAVVDDPNGADDIANVSLRILDGVTVLGEFKGASLDGTPVYSIVSNATEFDIDTGTSSWAESGETGTLTLKIRAEWDVTGSADLELSATSTDTGGESSGWTQMQTNYFDIITRLVTNSVVGDNTYVVMNTNLTINGLVRYATTVSGNTASSSYPPDAQFTDVAIHNATNNEEGTDTSIVNGAFSVEFTVPNAIGTYVYHVYLDLVADYSDADAPDADTVTIYTVSATMLMSFDDETGTTTEDVGGSDNDGTISGATRTGIGIYGRAISFDGTDDYIQVTQSATLNITGDFCVTAWIYTGDPDVQGILYRTGAYGLALISNYGVRFTVNTTNLDTAPDTISANTWVFIAGVYNGSHMLIYIDGVLDTYTSQTGVVAINTNDLFIGNVTTSFFNGTLDEIRLLNYEPSASEISGFMWDPISTYPYNLQAVITTMDAGDWVFTDEDYTFTGTYVRQNASYAFDSFGLRFTDGASYANMTFDAITDEYEVSAIIVHEMTNTNSSSGNEISIAWEVYIDNKIYDALNVDIELFCNDTLGTSDGYEVVETDYFNIYNLGGQVEYEYSGDGGSVVGEGVFALAATNSTETSWATANVTWRKLQRVNFLVHIWQGTSWDAGNTHWDCPNEHNNTGYVEYGINYYYDDAWLEGWKVRIVIENGEADANNAWVLVNSSWYNRESFVKSDTFYVYYEAMKSTDVTTQFALRVDLWVDIAESSSRVGGRVNAEYFGMDKTGWLIWTDWGPIYGLVDESVFSDDLLNNAGTGTISAQGLDMFSAWATVNKTAPDSGSPTGDSHQWALVNYNGPFWQRLSPFEVMSGISPPPKTDTVLPGETPSNFFTNLIAAMIDGITKPIVNALTDVQSGLWFMVETAINIPFEWFGIVDAVNLLTTYISGFVTYFATSLTNVVLLIVQIFTMINNVSSALISWLTSLTSMFVRISTIVVSILDGTHSVASGLGDVWDTMAWNSWSDGVPVFIAIAWMYSIDNRARRMGGGWNSILWGDINIVLGIVGFLLNMFSLVIDVVLGTIFRIMGAIGG